MRKSVNSVAPAGLPRNCYNVDWLKKINNFQRRELQIFGEAYDFSWPADLETEIPDVIEVEKIQEDVVEEEEANMNTGGG